MDLGEQYDQFLEEKLAISDKLDLDTLQDDSDLNDETFNINVDSNDFDFSNTYSNQINLNNTAQIPYNNGQNHRQQIYNHPPTNNNLINQPPPMSLIEIENMMRSQQRAQYNPPPQPSSLSFDEVEKQMRNSQRNTKEINNDYLTNQPEFSNMSTNDNHSNAKSNSKKVNKPMKILKRPDPASAQTLSREADRRLDDNVSEDEPVFDENEFPTLGKQHFANKPNKNIAQPQRQESNPERSHSAPHNNDRISSGQSSRQNQSARPNQKQRRQVPRTQFFTDGPAEPYDPAVLFF
jgi:hypothetical protein